MGITVRSIKASDSDQVYKMRIEKGVYDTTLTIPFSKYEISVEGTKGIAFDKDSVCLVAVDEKEDGSENIVGICTLTVAQNFRIRHRGEVGIVVSSKYHGLGVGTILFEKILDIADNWLMLDRLELTLMAGNDAAEALYKKFGFVVEGRKKKAVIRDGEYKDEIIMGRLREDIRKSK